LTDELISPPQRYCTIDRKPIPVERFRHGSNTCSPECAKLDKDERRDWKASKLCRLCKRPPKRPRVPKQANAVTEGVRQAHNAGMDAVLAGGSPGNAEFES
jgi:predicted nucleic acid-binding Zn ribbon protein